MKPDSYTFSPIIEIIGINPFVFVPDKILQNIFKQAGKSSGHIRVKGFINSTPFEQTLVKYSGAWRLYINTSMLKKSPQKIGGRIKIEISFNPAEKKKIINTRFLKALAKNKTAQASFLKKPPSLQNEIVGYIAKLKTEEACERNIKKAISYLLGKGSFVGRKPE